MKKYLFMVVLFMGFSCTKTNTAITWYDPIVVTTIEKDSENPENYRVALGISAQVFHLSPKTENFSTLLEELSQSYRDQQPVKIGVENGTNQIKTVLPAGE